MSKYMEYGIDRLEKRKSRTIYRRALCVDTEPEQQCLHWLPIHWRRMHWIRIQRNLFHDRTSSTLQLYSAGIRYIFRRNVCHSLCSSMLCVNTVNIHKSKRTHEYEYARFDLMELSTTTNEPYFRPFGPTQFSSIDINIGIGIEWQKLTVCVLLVSSPLLCFVSFCFLSERPMRMQINWT